MLPKIIFRYSNVYDERFRQAWISRKEKKPYPSPKRIISYKKQIEKEWGNVGKKILRELENITGLKWWEKEIKCYVVGRTRAFSDPLTIAIFKDKTFFIDILTHELIHQILSQNRDNSKDFWKYMHSKYKTLNQKTVTHIPLNAIHKKLYLKLFGSKRLERDIKRSDELAPKHPEYKKAWQIVNNEGYENIINEFRKR